jgi:hypothetical protein
MAKLQRKSKLQIPKQPRHRPNSMTADAVEREAMDVGAWSFSGA